MLYALRLSMFYRSRLNENSLARFCIFEEVSDPGIGDAGLRDSGDVDGGGVSGGDEADHR